MVSEFMTNVTYFVRSLRIVDGSVGIALLVDQAITGKGIATYILFGIERCISGTFLLVLVGQYQCFYRMFRPSILWIVLCLDVDQRMIRDSCVETHHCLIAA